MNKKEHMQTKISTYVSVAVLILPLRSLVGYT